MIALLEPPLLRLRLTLFSGNKNSKLIILNGSAPENFFPHLKLREFLQEIDKISLEHKPHVTATQENIGRTKYYMPAKSTEIPDMDDE